MRAGKCTYNGSVLQASNMQQPCKLHCFERRNTELDSWSTLERFQSKKSMELIIDIALPPEARVARKLTTARNVSDAPGAPIQCWSLTASFKVWKELMSSLR